MLPWLMGRDISTLPTVLPSCREPGVAQSAATLGYTYLIERRAPGLLRNGPALGLTSVYQADDADVYEVVTEPSPVLVSAMQGFWPIERTASASWRWVCRTFAGEHCSYDFQGYMNGAAQSGADTARAIMAAVSSASTVRSYPRRALFTARVGGHRWA